MEELGVWSCLASSEHESARSGGNPGKDREDNVGKKGMTVIGDGDLVGKDGETNIIIVENKL